MSTKCLFEHSETCYRCWPRLTHPTRSEMSLLKTAAQENMLSMLATLDTSLLEIALSNDALGDATARIKYCRLKTYHSRQLLLLTCPTQSGRHYMNFA